MTKILEKKKMYILFLRYEDTTHISIYVDSGIICFNVIHNRVEC